jgi:hypothetical protein
MSFKPFTEKYRFDKSILTEDFPDYLAEPVSVWLYRSLDRHDLLETKQTKSYRTDEFLVPSFRHTLQLDFQRTFSSNARLFVNEVLGDSELFCNILAYVLQNHSTVSEARDLERILRMGSSAYMVMEMGDDLSDWQRGVCNLGWRVPAVVQEEAREALAANELLKDAWNECYKRTPNPSLCVSKCTDFFEGFLRDLYSPDEERTPPIVRYVKDFEKDPSELVFKGSDFLEDKSKVIALMEGTSKIRAEHTTGKGRPATYDEAVFVLHTTIYLWNLMR